MTPKLRAKKAICRLLGHVPMSEEQVTPTGWIAKWTTCRRCGALLDWQEAPTHV